MPRLEKAAQRWKGQKGTYIPENRFDMLRIRLMGFIGRAGRRALSCTPLFNSELLCCEMDCVDLRVGLGDRDSNLKPASCPLQHLPYLSAGKSGETSRSSLEYCRGRFGSLKYFVHNTHAAFTRFVNSLGLTCPCREALCSSQQPNFASTHISYLSRVASEPSRSYQLTRTSTITSTIRRTLRDNKSSQKTSSPRSQCDAPGLNFLRLNSA